MKQNVLPVMIKLWNFFKFDNEIDSTERRKFAIP